MLQHIGNPHESRSRNPHRPEDFSTLSWLEAFGEGKMGSGEGVSG